MKPLLSADGTLIVSKKQESYQLLYNLYCYIAILLYCYIAILLYCYIAIFFYKNTIGIAVTFMLPSQTFHYEHLQLLSIIIKITYINRHLN